MEAALAPGLDEPHAGERHVIADQRHPVGGGHAEDLLAGRGRLGLLDVEAHLPVGIGQRPDIVVGRVGHQQDLLAAGIQHVDHVTRRVPEGRHSGDTRHDAVAVAHELELLGEGRHLGGHRFVGLGGPVVVVDLAADIACVRIGQVAGVVGQTADVVAVHMGDDDDRDVARRDPGGLQSGSGAGGAEARVEQHHFAAGPDNRRVEEELRLVGGYEVPRADRRKLLGRHIQAEDGLDVFDSTRSRKQRRDLEIAQCKGVLDRVLRAVPVASGKRRRCGQTGGQRQRGGSGKHGAAGYSGLGHRRILP